MRRTPTSILLATCLHASVVRAQSRPLAPLTPGAREVRGFFLPPSGEPAGSYVTGHAMLLRDPGALVSELAQLCASARAEPDSTRTAMRRRVSRAFDDRLNALRCLECLVVPEPAERVVTPLSRTKTRGARPA